MIPETSHPRNPVANILVALLPLPGILIIGGAFIDGLAQQQGTTAIDVLDNLTKSLYLPTMNYIDSHLIGGRPFNSYIYILWALLAVIIYTTTQLLFRKRPTAPGLSPLLFSISLWIFITATSLQTVNQVRTHLFEEARLLKGKTTVEKISLNFPTTYAFARYCQEKLPGQHVGRAITDLNQEIPAQFLTRVAIKYYLYPIDIRTRQDIVEDCLVIFSKRDPLNSVEPGFIPLTPFDATSLIAVRP